MKAQLQLVKIILPACFASILAICFCAMVQGQEPNTNYNNRRNFISDFSDDWTKNRASQKRFKNTRVVPIRRALPKKKASTTALEKIESLFTTIADGVLILGCVVGGPLMLWGFIELAIGAADGVLKVILGVGGIVGGLATPHCIGWLFDYAKSANLF